MVQCKIQLAGFAAEELLLGSSGYGYHQEAATAAFGIAQSIVSEGINLKDLPESLRATYISKALELKKQHASEIKALLAKHKDKLKLLTDALLKKHTLTGKEAAQIVGLPYKDPAEPAVSKRIQQELGIVEA